MVFGELTICFITVTSALLRRRDRRGAMVVGSVLRLYFHGFVRSSLGRLQRIRLTNRTYHFAAEFAEVGG